MEQVAAYSMNQKQVSNMVLKSTSVVETEKYGKFHNYNLT